MNRVPDGWKYRSKKMSDYKSKPARIKDKVRKMIKWPGGSKTGTFGSAGTGHGGTTSNIGTDNTKPFKKKPPRKGRPDGS
jgi:hypothetical protein